MKAYEICEDIRIDHDLGCDDLVWLDVRKAPFIVSGVFYDEKEGCFIRMPQKITEHMQPDAKWLNRQTAGGRVRFATDSKFIAFHAVMNNDEGPHTAIPGKYSFDLMRKNETLTENTFCSTFTPPERMGSSFTAGYYTYGDREDYILLLPYHASVLKLYIGLPRDAELFSPVPYKYEKPVVFYGSSITQGALASRPGNTYQSIISKHLDMNYISLGYAGNAMGESAVAEYIAGLDMSAFVLDYDHNAPNAEHLKATHLTFYRIIREKNPTLPIVIMSAPNIMPWYDWHIARRDVIRNTYETAVAEGDSNVYFIDGETLFDGPDRDLCTVDTCHPNDIGMYRMATVIEKTLSGILE